MKEGMRRQRPAEEGLRTHFRRREKQRVDSAQMLRRNLTNSFSSATGRPTKTHSHSSGWITMRRDRTTARLWRESAENMKSDFELISGRKGRVIPEKDFLSFLRVGPWPSRNRMDQSRRRCCFARILKLPPGLSPGP